MSRLRASISVALFTASCSAPSLPPLPPAPQALTPWVHAAIPPAPKVTFVDPAIELRSFVVHFTGEAPVDCGLHRLEPANRFVGVDRLEAAVACAKEAAAKPMPFWTFQGHFGTDGWSAQGLAGTAAGTTYWFSYDGDPCGSDAGCSGRFTLRRCPQPSVVAVDRPGRSTIKDAAIGCWEKRALLPSLSVPPVSPASSRTAPLLRRALNP